MRIGNPAVRRLEKVERSEAENASYLGIALKCLYFAGLTVFSAAISFIITTKQPSAGWLMAVAIGCPIAALVFGLIASFARRTIPVTGTLYVIFEGLAVGFISCLFEAMYAGVIFSALLATCCTLTVMALLFGFKVIRVGKMFVGFMCSLLGAVMFTQFTLFIISLFSAELSAMIYGNGALAIIISVVMCLLASFMILADLKTMTTIVENGLDKSYEWTASFGLVTTLIWLYLEFLRLFAIIASRKN